MSDNTKLVLWVLLLSSSSSCFGSELDVQCLKTVQQSVIDPNGILKSLWNFDNTTDDGICRFTGVECWKGNDSSENKVSALRLSSLGLQGHFPRGLTYCTGLVELDLSNNNFSGPIPSNILWQVTYLIYLDLSYNSFSGEIPAGIGNMDLYALYIQHNKLSGQIPREFYGLLRLTSLNVADNGLSGPIPSSLSKFPASNFAGNQRLCGAPLDDCGDRTTIRLEWRPHTLNNESSIGAAAGFVVGFVVSFYFPHCFVCSRRLHPYIFRIC